MPVFLPAPQLKPYQSQQVNWSHPVARGLVGCWLFNQGGGSTANDITDRTADGTFNSVAWLAGPYGPTLSVTGSGQFLDCGNPTKLQFSNAVPFSVFTRFLKNSNGGLTYGSIATKQGTTNGKLGYTLHVTSAGKLEFELDNTNVQGGNCVGATTLSNATWYTGGGSYDGANNQKVYVNGVLDGSATNSLGAVSASDDNLYIGNDKASTTQRFFNGQIDVVYIWNRCLTPNEFKILNEDPYCVIRPLYRRWSAKVTVAGGTGGPFPHYTYRLLTGGMLTLGG